MKIFELNRHIFTWLNLCPDFGSCSQFQKWLRFTIVAIILITECLAVLASSMFIHRFFETDIENCLYALFQVAALFSVIYMWTAGFIQRNTISKIFVEYQEIYENSTFRLSYNQNIHEIINSFFFRRT